MIQRKREREKVGAIFTFGSYSKLQEEKQRNQQLTENMVYACGCRGAEKFEILSSSEYFYCICISYTI